MFGWIASLFSRAASDVTQGVKDLVNAAMRGLYGFLHGIFRAVLGGWGTFWRDVSGFYRAFGKFTYSTLLKFVHILKILWPAIVKRVEYVYNFLLNFIKAAVKSLTAYILKIYHILDTFIRWLWNWVLVNVYRPLLAFIEKAWAWITREGATMWHYFTNLADFAELLIFHIAASLEKHAWELASSLGKFFLTLIVRNVVKFATLIETIIDAVL